MSNFSSWILALNAYLRHDFEAIADIETLTFIIFGIGGHFIYFWVLHALVDTFIEFFILTNWALKSPVFHSFEEFLRMRPHLGAYSGSNECLDFVPALAVQLETLEELAVLLIGPFPPAPLLLAGHILIGLTLAVHPLHLLHTPRQMGYRATLIRAIWHLAMLMVCRCLPWLQRWRYGHREAICSTLRYWFSSLCLFLYYLRLIYWYRGPPDSLPCWQMIAWLWYVMWTRSKSWRLLVLLGLLAVLEFVIKQFWRHLRSRR